MAEAPGAPAMAAARAVADAVLYEGYLLYPYRRSSGKNRIRWQFGVLLPPGWARSRGLDDTSVAGSAESWWQQTECLAEAGPAAEVTVTVRFLQIQRRLAAERQPAGPHPELTFDEAVPREFTIRAPVDGLLAWPRRVPLAAPGGREVSGPAGEGEGTAGGSGGLAGGDGGAAGRVVRQRQAVAACAVVSAEPCPQAPSLVRLRVRIENTGTVAEEAPREEALRVSPVACHVLLAVRDGAFVSLLDPPAALRQAARACVNVHTFPVLAGPEGQRAVMLSSPILMYDHPGIAPESPGDLHDGTEIDEILSLRALTLTEAEKSEARATDQRAAAILDRVETMPPEVMSRLHGAVRSLRPVAGHPAPGAARPGGPAAGPGTPWWDPGADASVSPQTDGVLIAGSRVAKGSRVLLRPRTRGTDPQDMFLAGRSARVEAVLLDVDGAVHLAVTLEDDPGADLHQWYGRFRYFSPGEVEPLAPGDGAGA